VVNSILAKGDIGTAQLAVPFKDFVRSDPQLEVFRDKEHLIDFLNSSQTLLENQMLHSPAKIQALMDDVNRTYDHFMQEKIAINPLIEQFKKLEGFFCRPPWGGPGGNLVGPDPDNDGPSGVTGSRSEKVCLYLTTATTVGTFLLPIIEKIFHHMSAGESGVGDETDDNYRLQVLALALTYGLVHTLESRQEMLQPAKVKAYAGVE
jgi:hypothetical protein